LAIDLDGTTVTDDGKILDGTIEDLNRARRAGTKVCIVTGRGQFEMVPFSDYAVMADFLITNTGATIMDLQQEKILYTWRVDPNEAKAIIDYCLQHNGLLHVNADLYWGVNLITDRVKSFAFDVHRDPTIYSGVAEVPIDRIEGFCMNDPQMCRDVAQMIERRGFHLYTVESQPYYFSILPQEVSKRKAIEVLFGQLGIHRENVIAVGNYTNDIDLIRHAGVGVAVQNATNDVKAVADFITDRTNNENAVGEVVERFVLG